MHINNVMYFTGEEVYPMNTNPMGYLLMINIKEFKDSGGNIIERMTRHGTDEDARRLREVFSRRGFKIIEKKDLSAKVNEKIHEISLNSRANAIQKLCASVKAHDVML